MTPGRRRKTLTERLRAIAQRFDARGDDTPHSRVSLARFERSHRDTVWVPPDPSRRWFEAQGIEPMDPKLRRSIQLRRWL